jgi:hypothetical protein
MINWFVGGSYWIDRGPKQQRGYAMMIPLKYSGDSPYQGPNKADVISREAYRKVLERYRERMIGEGDVFTVGQPNKELASAIGVYLYTAYYDQGIQFERFGCIDEDGNRCIGTHFKSFSYPRSKGGSGQEFTFGEGPYNAHTLMRDWLMYRMDGWFARSGPPYGNREFDSNNYHRHFPHMLMLLAEFAPEEDIRVRAKMSADIALLDALMDFSANSWGGTLGRTDYKHMDRSPVFPHRALWGISGDEGGADKWDISAVYAVDHAPTPLLVALSRFEEDWRFHREYNEQLNHAPGKGKWTYLTPNYNLGSSVGRARQGWTASVRGPGDTAFIRFFINDLETPPPDKQETSYQGDKGYQFRNAMFVNLGTTPHYWEFRSGVNWDEETSESGWTFKRLGSVFVALRLGPSTAAVELAEKGVDYPSFSAFKEAVKGNASLRQHSFTTSKGVVIGKDDPCGVDSPGDCQFPFNPMETDSSHGKLIDWQDGVMTVSKDGLSCGYDFDRWTYAGNACEPGGGSTPDTTFTDVPESHWAYGYIEVLYQNGYVAGCSLSPPKFCPARVLDRAESAVFVVRGVQGAGFTPQPPAEITFADTPSDAWFTKWTQQLWTDGYTAGCSTDPIRYCPARDHTMAEGAVFYMRMLEGADYEPPAAQGIFADAPEDAWYARWVEAAYSAGLYPPCQEEPEPRACPLDPLDRATAAYMMALAKGLMER